jgi:hypothetical protein
MKLAAFKCLASYEECVCRTQLRTVGTRVTVTQLGSAVCALWSNITGTAQQPAVLSQLSPGTGVRGPWLPCNSREFVANARHARKDSEEQQASALMLLVLLKTSIAGPRYITKCEPPSIQLTNMKTPREIDVVRGVSASMMTLASLDYV